MAFLSFPVDPMFYREPATTTSMSSRRSRAHLPAISDDTQKENPPLFKRTSSFGACDVRNTKEARLVTIDAPGVELADITLQVTSNKRLTICGERKPTAAAAPEQATVPSCADLGCGKFVRCFLLPKNADAAHIVARVEGGVVVVSIPTRRGSDPQIPRSA